MMIDNGFDNAIKIRVRKLDISSPPPLAMMMHGHLKKAESTLNLHID
jgi:hypothetical protein